MLHTLQTGVAQVPAGALAELRAHGVADDDIAAAYTLQEQQRACGVTVLPLAVICGLKPFQPGFKSSLSRTASRLLGTKPRAQVSRGGTHITRRPVWAGSVRTGEAAEHDFVRSISADQRRALSRACYLTFERGRDLAAQARAGRELTADEAKLTLFTRSCRDMMLRILDELQYRKGWCNPSYETLMRWTGLGRRAVKYCLDRLRDLGLLEWIRRYIYTRDSEQGARSEQTSNLYRCQLPNWIGKLIGLFAPVPDDEEQRRADSLEQHAEMLASTGAVERRRLMPQDAAQRAALILAGERAEQRRESERLTRECNQCTPPHPNKYILREEKRSCPSRATSQP
ncbi:plasmid stability protein [Sphingobium sp. OAS761]|uniref:helix-turn-helix domain-containing protein n=1 Tax=Sphingobium sp. OAS761 TaxID=2817901 RepID=UPI0020A18F87|nr:helix-turn-helix domain-containing protein [Sphingobium sp. OAS761]MCP1472238.1 plasmid stability protein [Sphingobium sp. OAS761]